MQQCTAVSLSAGVKVEPTSVDCMTDLSRDDPCALDHIRALPSYIGLIQPVNGVNRRLWTCVHRQRSKSLDCDRHLETAPPKAETVAQIRRKIAFTRSPENFLRLRRVQAGGLAAPQTPRNFGHCWGPPRGGIFRTWHELRYSQVLYCSHRLLLSSELSRAPPPPACEPSMHIQCCSGLQRARPQESQEVTPIGFSFAACSDTQIPQVPAPTLSPRCSASIDDDARVALATECM